MNAKTILRYDSNFITYRLYLVYTYVSLYLLTRLVNLYALLCNLFNLKRRKCITLDVYCECLSQ